MDASRSARPIACSPGRTPPGTPARRPAAPRTARKTTGFHRQAVGLVCQRLVMHGRAPAVTTALGSLDAPECKGAPPTFWRGSCLILGGTAKGRGHEAPDNAAIRPGRRPPRSPPRASAARRRNPPSKFVPQADLANLDPSGPPRMSAAITATPCFDTLYGIDAKFTATPRWPPAPSPSPMARYGHHPARRPEIPRWQPRARARRGRQPAALGQAGRLWRRPVRRDRRTLRPIDNRSGSG